jgi:hypothetical protein
LNEQHDVDILRELGEAYARIATDPKQDERRRLWADHYSLKRTRPPVIAGFGMWNVWAREVFADENMECRDPELRGHERGLRMALFQDDIGDDTIQEPWFHVQAVRERHEKGLWGINLGRTTTGHDGDAWKFDPPVQNIVGDMEKLKAPRHEIDEEATAAKAERMRQILGDILPVHVDRGPICRGFQADISTDMTQMLGMTELMVAMYEQPEALHSLAAYMRDAILAVQDAAEEAGDYSLAESMNQGQPYCHELPWPEPNSHGARREQLWGFCAAQEFALVGPQQHEEFLLQYQKPIFEKYGLMHYGCCEDLGRKIDMLRDWENLRSIAVTPAADVAVCAEQIGPDYVSSWRPNPTDMVCTAFDEDRIRRIVGSALETFQSNDCRVHLNLKDVETLQGETDRMRRWTALVRRIIDEVWE